VPFGHSSEALLDRKADGGSLYCNANWQLVDPIKDLTSARSLNISATAVKDGIQTRKSMWTTWFLQEA
jgi:hypothetical protein